jgi:hypothetical protein|nr:MAG TPA: hypothetical protein [Caudoviricetes sp.]
MERKVGEIFEYNGEWYQCIHTKSFGCENCNLTVQNNIHCIDAFKIRGECLSSNRKDGKSVIFKKLEKVGEPFVYEGKVLQRLRSIDGYSCVHCLFKEQACNFDSCDKDSFLVETELKLENMEEKKLNLKPFDFEAAKAGKPVCTRDGRKARIICFDTINKGNYPIIALLEDKGCEAIFYYNKDGKCNVGTERDLMMLPEKKEGWINIYKDFEDTVCCAYLTKEDALKNRSIEYGYITTIKIEWEE